MATFSRTPSPAARSGSDSDSVVATPMTPRTKMRQLFATIGGDDDSSDSDREREGDDNNHTPSRKTKKSPASKTSATKAHKATSAVPHTKSATRSRTTSPRLGPLSASSDESDVEVRPRGRLAARMQANSTATATATAPKPVEPLADNARERVRRMLQLPAKSDKPEPEQATAQNPEDTNDAEDEEDVSLPAARPRKRLSNMRTSRRSASASSHGASPSRQLTREDSPAMFMSPSKRTEREDSPDMFMSPTKAGDDGTVEGAKKPGRNARFEALVARKREQARAREEAEEEKRAARLAAMADEDEDDDLLMADADGNVSDITDDDGGRQLSQKTGASRPPRKASKKALEEMHRETQRMSRNLQLVHEAKTRKKITKASLFERFNFKPQGAAAATPAEPSVKEATGSSRPASPASEAEAEAHIDSDTPPSSPPVPEAKDDEPFAKPADVATTSVDKGKGKAVEVVETGEQPLQAQPKRQVRVRMPVSATANVALVDSDEDVELEIVQTSKSKINMLFDSVPLKHEQEPRSMMTLRRLAQVGSPGRKSRRAAATDKADLSLGELQQSLQSRARLQAKKEREERLEALRAKGVRILTEEEREKEMEEVDDIVTRARQEAEELMQREREEAKEANKDKKGKSGDADGEVDPLDWDDSDDEEDYTPEDDEEEARDIELSGSEDDNADEGEEEGDEEDAVMEGALIDGEAESAEEEEDGEGEAAGEDDTGAADILPTPTRARPSKRRALIVSDDEDEDSRPATASATPPAPKTEAKTPGPKPRLTANTPSGVNSKVDSPAAPTSVLRSATKPFIPGLPIAVGGPAGLGLTQIFAGTLNDDDDSQAMGSNFGSPSQLMPTLGNFAEPVYSQTAFDKASGVLDSQPTQEWLKRMTGSSQTTQNQESGTSTSISQMVDLNFSQSQVHGLESLLREPEMSQMSQILGPSQDLDSQYTPLKVRFIEHQPSTAETVVLDKPTQKLDPAPEVTAQAPARPRGRLFRKVDMIKAVVEAEEEEDEEEEEEDEEDEAERAAAEASVFAKMKEASALEKKFRKKSKAKEMVEDQAEESEDEYAGLGGADGEDSDDESLASVKDLIDDQKVSSEDSAKLAAFYADRERANDEKQVEKLFRDVTTGMLRRKRGAGGGGGGDYDLSDSDDGGEARRRMKRRQFARMQKALFADERVSKVAENPRSSAFMRTIEDRGSDDEMDFLFEGSAAAAAAAAAAVSVAGAGAGADAPQGVAIPDSQPVPTATTEAADKPALALALGRRRRTSATSGKKPSNLGEIRESLSNLLEDYQHTGRESSTLSMVADSEFGSDHDEEGDDDNDGGDNSQASNKENNPLATASSFRRPGGRARNVQVVDRISLKRNNSSASSASASSLSSTSSASGPTGFRVPALLRRATTNSLASTSSSSRSGSGRNANFSMSTTRGPADTASSSSSSNSNAPDSGKIKKNASKMSGIHYFARENERLATLAENDKRRQAKKVRSAEGRSRAVGGLFGAGKFE